MDIQDTKEKFISFFKGQNRLHSYSEICKLFGYKSKNASFLLVKRMIEAGLIAKSEGGKLVPKSLTQSLRVLGTVQAGFPSPAEENLLNTLSLDEFLIRNHNASFLLRVTGDSMIEEGIMPDDLVVVERGRAPKNNDVVLAQMDGEWTLKYYRDRDEKGTRVSPFLVAANKKYPVMIPKQELKVSGVVASVVRKYF